MTQSKTLRRYHSGHTVIRAGVAPAARIASAKTIDHSRRFSPLSGSEDGPCCMTTQSKPPCDSSSRTSVRFQWSSRANPPGARISTAIGCPEQALPERRRHDQATLAAELAADLVHVRAVRVHELEGLHVRAVEERARVALARVPEHPCPHAVRRRDRHHDRIFDAVLVADVLDEADRTLDGRRRIVLEPVRE